MAWQPAGALPNQICDSGATCAAYACQCWVVWQHFQGCHREIRPEFSGFVTYDRTRRPNTSTGACTASFRVCALNSETISESLPVAVACSLCAWLTTWAHILRTCAKCMHNLTYLTDKPQFIVRPLHERSIYSIRACGRCQNRQYGRYRASDHFEISGFVLPPAEYTTGFFFKRCWSVSSAHSSILRTAYGREGPAGPMPVAVTRDPTFLHSTAPPQQLSK